MQNPTIEHHWLEWSEPGIELEKKRDRVSNLIVPECIVIHYGVTHSLSALVAAQRSAGYWAHLSIDGFFNEDRVPVYQLHQSIAFNQRGSHAGQSTWQNPVTGVLSSGVNSVSIGIEIANPGPLVRGADGKLRTVYGKEWPEDDAVELRHKFPRTPKSWTHWAKYSEQEIEILKHVCAALRDAYPTIVDVVGHDDISPGRKFDPGPAFPMDELRSHVFGGAAS